MSPSVELPTGFVLDREGLLLMAIRSDVRADVAPLVQQWATNTLPSTARLLAGGRGGVCAFDVNGLGVVLRPYRRGGWAAQVTSDLYLGWRIRSVRELIVTETLRGKGIPTLEVLAGAAHWIMPACYRAALVTREVPDARNLWEELKAISRSERPAICMQVADVTRRLHDVGAVHPDLNLQNYLVRRAGGEIHVLIIDHDRTRFGRVTPRVRAAAWARVQRSIHRLDPQGEILTAECVDALRAIGEGR